MALIQANFFSNSLMRTVPINVVLPNDAPPFITTDNPHYERPTKTLILLHGFSGSISDWLTGSDIQELALKYNLAVVMPSGENSFYLNGKGAGSAYETYTGSELITYVRKTFGLSDKSEDTFIGGLSMGGFGAIHTGLKFPENFGKIFGLSSALIVHNIKDMQPGTCDAIADYDYYERAFGKLDELEASEKNPETLIIHRQEKGETIQPIFMACGNEDFLLKENHIFRDFLTAHNVDFIYKESPGTHDWKFWNEYLETSIQWILGC